MRKILLLAVFVFCMFIQENKPAVADVPDGWVENMIMMFNAMDLNRDGRWTHEEYMNSINLTIAPDELKEEEVNSIKAQGTELFKKIDLDNNGFVTQEEYTSEEVYERAQQEILSAGE